MLGYKYATSWHWLDMPPVQRSKSVHLMQALVAEDPHQRKLTEDYAVMTYNLAQQLRRRRRPTERPRLFIAGVHHWMHRSQPELQFDAALLLRNNLDAAIRYAHMAEARIDTLEQDERSALFRYLAELYRRSGDRQRAREYIGYLVDS